MLAPSYDLPSESWSSRKASGVSSSLSPKALRTKRTNDVNFSLGQEKTNISAQHSGTETNSPFLCLFYSIQAPNGLTDAHPHWGAPYALLSLLTQMPVSSGNTFTDAPRNNVSPITWALCGPS